MLGIIGLFSALSEKKNAASHAEETNFNYKSILNV